MINKGSIKKALWIGLSINVFLACSKVFFGITGNSKSLFTDGVNAFTDVLVSIMMLVVLGLAHKKPDHDHHYGHEKYEGLVYFLLAIIFIVSSVWIMYEGLIDLINIESVIIVRPEVFTVYVSILGIIMKLFLYYYYKIIGKQSKSPVIIADAKNHLIDVLATSIALLGILFTKYIHPSFDIIASIVIGLFILRLGVQIFIESTAFLTDKAPDKEEVEAIKQVILSMSQVLTIDDLKVRRHMTQRYVDVEIGVDRLLSLEEAHRIAEKVHDNVEQTFPDVLHCMVHVNPKNKTLIEVS